MAPLIFKTTARLVDITKRKRVTRSDSSLEPSNSASGSRRSVSVEPPFTGTWDADGLGGRLRSVGPRNTSNVGDDDQPLPKLPRDQWRRWALDSKSSQMAGWTRVNGHGVNGTLARWSCELLPSQVTELFNIVYNPQTGGYVHSQRLAEEVKMRETERVIEGCKFAQDAFFRVHEKRTQLGISGNVLEGQGHLIPETNKEKMEQSGGAAAAGPINTIMTEKERLSPGKSHVEKLNGKLEKLLLSASKHLTFNGQLSGSHPGSKLRFEYIGNDPLEDDVFYFVQKNRLTPSRDGEQKWQLRCKRERVWKSAAPRAYGPSRSWGGAWGGGVLKFTNSVHTQGPTQTDIAGGEHHEIDVFSLTCVDEGFGSDNDGDWNPVNVSKTPLAKVATFGSIMPQVYADGKMPSTSSNDSKVSIARSLTGGKIGGATSFVRIMPCKTGFPEHGYPGWSDRELVREGTAILRESPGKQIGFGDGEQSSQAIFGHDERPSRDASSVMRDESTFGGNSWQSHDARRSVMRDKVTWSDDVRDSRPPQGTGKSIHLLAASQISETPSGFNSDGKALSRMRTGEGTYTPARKLMVELHGAGGGVYPRQGGPNLHKASLESWRMPHTQAGDFEKATADDMVWQFASEREEQLRESMEAARSAPVQPPFRGQNALNLQQRMGFDSFIRDSNEALSIPKRKIRCNGF